MKIFNPSMGGEIMYGFYGWCGYGYLVGAAIIAIAILILIALAVIF